MIWNISGKEFLLHNMPEGEEIKQALAKLDKLSKKLDKMKARLDKVTDLDKRLKKIETQLEKLSK